MELRLPNVRMAIRGDLPDVVIDALSDLTRADLHLGVDAADIEIELNAVDVGWRAVGSHRAFPDVTAGPDPVDLLDRLVVRCNHLAYDLDPDRLHLRAACVSVDGTGILLAGPSGAVTSTVATELLRRGAAYLGDESVVLLPGSHTVYGYPKPLSLERGSLEAVTGRRRHPVPQILTAPSGRGYLRAGSIADVAAVTRTGAIVFLHHDTAHGIDLRPVDPAVAAIRLLSDSLDAARLGPGTLDTVAPVVAGSSCWDLDCTDAVEAAAVISELRPLLRPRLVVPVRWTPGSDGNPTVMSEVPSDHVRDISSDRSDHTVRIGEHAVRFEGSTRRMILLDPETDPGAGADAEAEVPGPGHRDDPVAYGLVDRGIGVARMAELTVDTTAALVAGRCSGVGLDQVVRGRAAAAGVVGSLSRDHVAAQATCVLLEHELPRIVDLLDDAGVDAILLKGPVSAHDGPLPSYLRDYGDLDLLVPEQRMDTAVSSLLAAGFERCFEPVAAGFDRRFAKSVTLRGPFSVHSGGPRGRTFELDLHRTLCPGPFGFRLPLPELHDAAVPVLLHGRRYRALHPEHRFLHAALHVALGSSQPRLHSLRDLVLVAPRTSAGVERVLATAARWRIEAVVRRAVAMVDDRFPSVLTEELRASLGSTRERFVDRVLLASYHRGRLSYSLPTAASLLVLPSWSDRWSLTRAHLLHTFRQGTSVAGGRVRSARDPDVGR